MKHYIKHGFILIFLALVTGHSENPRSCRPLIY